MHVSHTIFWSYDAINLVNVTLNGKWLDAVCSPHTQASLSFCLSLSLSLSPLLLVLILTVSHTHPSHSPTLSPSAPHTPRHFSVGRLVRRILSKSSQRNRQPSRNTSDKCWANVRTVYHSTSVFDNQSTSYLVYMIISLWDNRYRWRSLSETISLNHKA